MLSRVEYIEKVKHLFPYLHIDKDPHLRLPELLKMVAVEIFVSGEDDPDLVETTKRGLASLRIPGLSNLR